MIYLEDIKILLKHPALKNVKNYSLENSILERHFSFEALFHEFQIKWYANVATLYHHGIEIRFDDIKIKSTWPNKFKTNIHLFNNGEIIAIIPIETYK